MNPIAKIDSSYWLVAAVVADFGDLLTTYIGVAMLGMAESNPVAGAALSALGIAGLCALKLVKYLGGAAAVLGFDRISPLDTREVVKIAAGTYAVIGAFTVINNTYGILLN